VLIDYAFLIILCPPQLACTRLDHYGGIHDQFMASGDLKYYSSSAFARSGVPPAVAQPKDIQQ